MYCQHSWRNVTKEILAALSKSDNIRPEDTTVFCCSKCLKIEEVRGKDLPQKDRLFHESPGPIRHS